jgi:leucyl-tRNA synthetase
MHRTIKKVTEDIEVLKMNTAIATLMALMNDINSVGKINKAEFKTLLILLNPFAPHITEELWESCGYEGFLNEASWPNYEESKCVDATVEIVAQINGKIRARLNIPAEIKQAKGIVADRADIITNAKREADAIVRNAEEKVKTMVAQEEIVKLAQAKAAEIIAAAQAKSREMRKAAQDFVDDVMRRADEGLTANLGEVRKTRAALRQQAPTSNN